MLGGWRFHGEFDIEQFPGNPDFLVRISAQSPGAKDPGWDACSLVT